MIKGECLSARDVVHTLLSSPHTEKLMLKGVNLVQNIPDKSVMLPCLSICLISTNLANNLNIWGDVRHKETPKTIII